MSLANLVPADVADDLELYFTEEETAQKALHAVSSVMGHPGDVWVLLTDRSLFFHTREIGRDPVVALLLRNQLTEVVYLDHHHGITLTFVSRRTPRNTTKITFMKVQQPEIDDFCEDLADLVTFQKQTPEGLKVLTPRPESLRPAAMVEIAEVTTSPAPEATPAATSVVESVAANVTTGVVESVAENVTAPVVEPIVESVAEPVMEPIAEPVAAFGPKPEPEPGPEPAPTQPPEPPQQPRPRQPSIFTDMPEKPTVSKKSSPPVWIPPIAAKPSTSPTSPESATPTPVATVASGTRQPDESGESEQPDVGPRPVPESELRLVTPKQPPQFSMVLLATIASILVAFLWYSLFRAIAKQRS